MLYHNPSFTNSELVCLDLVVASSGSQQKQTQVGHQQQVVRGIVSWAHTIHKSLDRFVLDPIDGIGRGKAYWNID